MRAAARNRSPEIDSDSFIVCFYCNESFCALSSLLEHCCSAEEKISLDGETRETSSDVSSGGDLSEENYVDNREAAFENQFDLPRLVIVEAESTTSSACELSLSITEKPLSETQIHLNDSKQEISGSCSNVLKNQSSEINSDGVKELSHNVSEKRLLEANLDVVTEKISKLISDAPKEMLTKENSDTKQKSTEVYSYSGDDINKTSADLGSKVLQIYEIKQGTLNICQKSPSTENKFYSPLPVVESDSSKHSTIQLECPASTMTSKPSSSKIECDISNSFSRSSSVESGLDSMAYDDSVANAISFPEKESSVLKHIYKQVRSDASKVSDKSIPEENFNITNYDSVIVKPCYVKVQDIFKSLSNPKKIFRRKKKYHVCDVCFKFFRLRSDLNIHYLVHTVVKPYVCNICEKSFIKESNLLAHHITHLIEKKHICSICKKAFPKKSILVRHELTHTKQKPFSCEKCGKSYQVKSSLTEHYLTHSNERPYVCEICSASFGNKRYLRRHYHTHQNSDKVCKYCYKIFKHKHHLEAHYNIHTDDKPYECKFCNRSFHLLLTLNDHYAMAHRIEIAGSPENVKTCASPESVKTFSDNSVGKIPVIQKIEVDDTCERTPVVQKIEKLDVVVKCEKAPVIQKIERSSIIHTNKDIPIYNTRRKTCIPKKYLQPD